MSDLYKRIYAVARQIPAGKVASYGQISKLVGTTARQVGYAMATLSHDTDVPWQRVINSKGEISLRTGSDEHNYQRILLEDEGIEFSLQGKIDLARYGWERKITGDTDDLFSNN